MNSAPQIDLAENDLSQEQLDFYLSKDIIAVDTELMGLNIKRDRLCLVQIGDEDRNIVLVKIDKGQTDAPNLKKLMESKDVIKLFHYARTDVACIKYWLGVNVDNFFCTKIASKIARTYTDKHSLRELAKEIAGKDMNKTQQSSDWGTDDLSKEQISYAASDVYHLIKIYHKLIEMLEREERMDLVKRCQEVVKVYADLDIDGYEDVFAH